jgi:segregation and condensation protein A
VWGRGVAAEDAVSEGVDLDVVAPLAPFPVHKLIEAFDRVMRQAKLKVSHDVMIDRLSVSQKIAELTDRLEAEGGFPFSSMFSFLTAERSLEEIRHEAVVTFLALLEMAKLRLITLRQHVREDAREYDDEEIFIASATSDLRARVEQTVAHGDDYR